MGGLGPYSLVNFSFPAQGVQEAVASCLGPLVNFSFPTQGGVQEAVASCLGPLVNFSFPGRLGLEGLGGLPSQLFFPCTGGPRGG